MKVIVFETEEWERDACRRLMPAHEVACTREALSEQTAGEFSEAEAVATFVNSKLDAGVLQLLPRLKLLATRSTGFDHIDLDYCRAHGITVCNVPGYGDHTVAEHAFALLLAIAQHHSLHVRADAVLLHDSRRAGPPARPVPVMTPCAKSGSGWRVRFRSGPRRVRRLATRQVGTIQKGCS